MDRTENTARPARPFNRGKRRKVCIFCADKVEYIDYKDTAKLKHFISERGKILPRRVSGACAKHQREVNTAITRARQAALLPFITDRPGANREGRTGLSGLPSLFASLFASAPVCRPAKLHHRARNL